MDIRNFRKKNLGKKRFFTAVIAVMVLLVILQIKNFFTNDGDQLVWSGDIFSGNTANNLIIGQKVVFAGNMVVDNHFPIYTHSIYRGSSQLGLRSSSINLNNYIGNLEIAGKVSSIEKGIPIVEVSVVKLEKPGLVIKGNTYLFIKDLIYFDFTDQTQLSANKSGKNITIYADKVKVFDVERFLCSKILTDKDCNQIIEMYISSQKEFFNSSWGYVYYKPSDKQRALFDGNLFGYMFKNADDSVLLDMSSMIRVINKDFVLENKKDQIKEHCQNDEEKIKDISFTKVGFNDPYYLVVTIEGNTKAKKNYSCNITFDLWNERAVKDVNFKIIK